MKKRFVNTLFFLFDFLFIVVLYYAIAVLRGRFDLLGLPEFQFESFGDFYIIFAIIMISLLYEKIYILRFDFWEETRQIIKALFLSFMIILSIIMLGKAAEEYSRLFLIMYFTGLLILLPIYKRIIKKIVFVSDVFKKRVKIVGNKDQAEVLTNEFNENWYLGLKVVKTLPDTIYIASKDIEKSVVQKYIKRYSLKVKDIYIIPYLTEINFLQSQTIELFNIKISLIKIENNLLKIENIFLKAVFEKVLILSILPIFLFLHAVISYLIKNDSKGDALFKQDRLGIDNKIFKCYKYRTMLENSDDLLSKYLEENPEEKTNYEKFHKYENDPRITKVGKFLRKLSLDELPQVINILKGDMSLIGPRPYMIEESSKLGSDKDIILRVKPGISGLWQVSGRSNLSFLDRKKLDLWYIQNWSLWMDIVIFIKTFKVLLFKTGAK